MSGLSRVQKRSDEIQGFHGSLEIVEYSMIFRPNLYGPVADDRGYLQFGLYESGVIGVETLIREL